MSAPIQQHEAADLAAGRTLRHDVIDGAGIVAFGVFAVWLATEVAHASGGNVWLVASALLLGFLGADFLSGFAHWAGDTWGSTRTPVVGAIFIRPFREHHVDQTAITRHGFVEVNGSNCLTSTPLLVVALLLPDDPDATGALFGKGFSLSLCISLFATNQIHKWAHLAKPPRLVALLQRWHLILPPDHHAVHHAAPYDKYYCITVGWLNAPLRWVGFFPALERVITATTGALPRQDDIGAAAAVELAVRKGISAAGAPLGDRDAARRELADHAIDG